jgi:bifunctional DNA-binding transcriptional regulator/antitoxin component of YhaV-PrlF toxin-antitoxin module
MQIFTTVSQKGQITLPKIMREQFSMEKYKKVMLVSNGDHIKIMPALDILDLADKLKLQKNKPILKARVEMEKQYSRI